jgi:hypothetical protein
MITYKDFTLTIASREKHQTVTVLPFLAFRETYLRTFIDGEPGPLLGYNEKENLVVPMGDDSGNTAMNLVLCEAISRELQSMPELETA